MTKKEFEKAYEIFFKTWGEKAQIGMCIEEMSELTQALCKYLRYGQNNISQELHQNILEELADVLNMTDQLCYIFDKKEIEKLREYKIKRTLKKIENIK